jgi:ADP-heptose:LPS heptosyltransferase
MMAHHRSNRNNLLIVHQGALGDFIVTFPILRALKQFFSSIHGICRASFGRLANHLNILDQHYPLDAACFATLYTDSIDPDVMELVAAYRNVLLFSFSETLEHAMRSVNGPKVYRIAPWPEASQSVHVTEFLANHLRESGLLESKTQEHFYESVFSCPTKHGGASGAIHSAVPVSDVHRRREKECERQSGRKVEAIQKERQRTPVKVGLQDGAKIVICPGAGSIKKRWSLSRFIKIAETLEARGWSPGFLLGPAEKDIASELSARSRNLFKITTPQDLPALATYLQTGHGYIGNDSAVSHLAAFLQVPTVAIFGPSDPRRWRPVGPNVAIVGPSPDCSPCFETGDDDCDHVACMEEITADRVLQAFYALFQW